MAKYGEGLGYEIVKAVYTREIIEPITYEKVEALCRLRGYKASKNHMRIILSNSTINTHSPTYKEYFQRIGPGKYILHPNYQKAVSYYWLNIDVELYDWSFSSKKIGDNMTFFNINSNGSKRMKQTCFKDIEKCDVVLAYETGKTQAITSICLVVEKIINGDKIDVRFQKVKEFNEPIPLSVLRNIDNVSSCNILKNHRGTLLEVDKDFYDEVINKYGMDDGLLDIYKKLERDVEIAKKLTSIERMSILRNTENAIPEKIEVKKFEFVRSPYVIAEVLERANGICEKCREKAPFFKKKDKTPYLEVHHKKRLADGGEDTVENAIAVCPNCHKELHYG